MSKRKIGLLEVLKNIRQGMDDAALKERYQLSERGLKSLYRELCDSGLLESEGEQYFIPAKRRIITSEIVSDILSGRTDKELRNKYKLSSLKFLKVLSKLVYMGALPRNVVSDRNIPRHAPEKQELRYAARAFPILSASIYEQANPKNRGRVRDLSDEGVGAQGLSVELDEVKTLVIASDSLLEVEPFSFQAKCRWSRIADDGNCDSGFEITFISGSDGEELQKLIQLMTVLL
jgi:hypothetical protein